MCDPIVMYKFKSSIAALYVLHLINLASATDTVLCSSSNNAHLSLSAGILHASLFYAFLRKAQSQ